MPPPFAEGLDDWSCGDGTPDGPTYDASENARLVRDDADFGACMELRTVGPLQRLRYMGEVPLLLGGFIEVAARVKAVRGPLPDVRVAAWAGGRKRRGSRACRLPAPTCRSPRTTASASFAPSSAAPHILASISSGTRGCSMPTSGSTSSVRPARSCGSRRRGA